GVRACAAAVAALLAGAALGGAGCATPPWYMGAPLDGKPSIPETSAAPSARQRKAEAHFERTARHPALELRALLALDEMDRLDSSERDRLAELLEQRAGQLLTMARQVP